MKFTIRIDELESLLKAVISRPRKRDTVRISACAARVFVECSDAVASVETLVFSDGAVTLPAAKFRELVKTYKGRTSLTFEGSTDGLRIENLAVSARGVMTPTRSRRQPSKFFQRVPRQQCRAAPAGWGETAPLWLKHASDFIRNAKLPPDCVELSPDAKPREGDYWKTPTESKPLNVHDSCVVTKVYQRGHLLGWIYMDKSTVDQLHITDCQSAGIR